MQFLFAGNLVWAAVDLYYLALNWSQGNTHWIGWNVLMLAVNVLVAVMLWRKIRGE